MVNPDAGACQQAMYKFEPKIPTVYLVVDRSGSMFHCLTTSELVCANKADTSWTKLKDAIQTVVMQLEAEVRFGFTNDLPGPTRPGADRARWSPPARSPTTSLRS